MLAVDLADPWRHAARAPGGDPDPGRPEPESGEPPGGDGGKIGSYPVRVIYWNLVWINLWWGLVNLLPIYPLDGGQATQVLLSQVDRRNGVRRGHIVSLLTAGILAVLAFWANPEDFYLPLFFGILALINFQVLQSLHQAQSFGVYQEDDWWRR